MDNKLKSKTRLAAIQLVSQQLINNQDIENIKEDFDKYYRKTKIDKSSEKISRLALKEYDWLRDLVEIMEKDTNPEHFMEYTKLQMFQDNVICFTF